VGPNGAGKSNFVEAIRFLSYALGSSLEVAVENGGGLQSIVHRGDEIASTIKLKILLELAADGKAEYEVEIRAAEDGTVVVAAEVLSRSAKRPRVVSCEGGRSRQQPRSDT
jgi:predicted ATPase